MKRIVKGKIEKFTGIPWANLPIKFQLNHGSYQLTPEINYPENVDVVTTDATGNFEISLWCNEIGGINCVYKCWIGNDKPFLFTVPIGSEPIDIATLRNNRTQFTPSTPTQTIGASEIREAFVPTPGQTTFALSNIPEYPHLTRVWLNGVKADFSNHFIIDGSILKWLSSIRLEPSDLFEVIYK